MSFHWHTLNSIATYALKDKRWCCMDFLCFTMGEEHQNDRDFTKSLRNPPTATCHFKIYSQTIHCPLITYLDFSILSSSLSLPGSTLKLFKRVTKLALCSRSRFQLAYCICMLSQPWSKNIFQEKFPGSKCTGTSSSVQENQKKRPNNCLNSSLY